MSIILSALVGVIFGFSSGFFAGAAWCSNFMRIKIKNEVMNDILQPNSEVISRLSAAMKVHEIPPNLVMEAVLR